MKNELRIVLDPSSGAMVTAPYFAYDTGALYAAVTEFNKTKYEITTKMDMSGYSGDITLWYTKTTD